MSDIDTGDVVTHCPSGEEWLVAYVQGEHLIPCGWPLSRARVADCVLTRKATPEQRDELLREMAAMRTPDARGEYARRAIGTAAAMCKGAG